MTTCGCGGGDSAGMRPLVPDPAVLTACTPGGAGVGSVRAKVVACSEELIGGRLASGRVGDLVIENAKVRVVIRGPGEGFLLHGTTGGGLIDVASVGADGTPGDDLVKEIQPLVDLNVGGYDEIVITEAGDDGPAEIVARGPAAVAGLIDAAITAQPRDFTIEHHWILAADESRLTMRTLIWGEGEDFSTVADALFMGGRARPFLPERGYPTSGSTAGQFLVFEGTTTSYGVAYPPEVPAVQLADIGGVRILFGPTLQPNDGVGATRSLIIGDGSIESITRQAWELREADLEMFGGAVEAGTSVVVTDLDGNVQTVARAGTTLSTYQARVPAGDYLIHTEGPGRAPGAPQPVTAGTGSGVVDPPVEPAGLVVVNAHEPGGPPLPARVTVWQDGDRKIVTWTKPDGTLDLPLAPGSYRLAVSRGLEYEVFTVDPLVVSAGTGSPAMVDATLTRVLYTTGWISADTHLHSEMSNDSTFPLEGRIAAVAGEGVELAISTDHDFITDYQPVIEDLGLGAWLASAIGEESSSVTIGHVNAWPLILDAGVAAHGAVPWFHLPPGEVFAGLRGQDPDRVVQVNHPRNVGAGLYSLIDFRPDTLTAGRDPEDLGFAPGTNLVDMNYDALEVCNEADTFDEVFTDWISQIAAGRRLTATGSSDSHGATSYAGKCRTFIRADTDSPAAIDVRAVNEAIRGGRVVVSTGAFISLSAADPADPLVSGEPGDVVTVTGGTARLTIRVQAPPWMPVGAMTIYQDKLVIDTIQLDPAETAVVRHDATHDYPIDGDTFFVVRVEMAGSGDPVLGNGSASFTNPVFVDADGDGMWTP